MSLINEALKKAQQQRTEGHALPPSATASPSNEPAQRVAKRRPPLSANTIIALLVGSLALTVVSGVATFLILSEERTLSDSTRTVAKSTPVPPSVPIAVATPSPDVSPVPAASVKPPGDPATPTAPPPSPTIAPLTYTLAAQASTTPPIDPAQPATPTASPQVHDFLEKMRISGIRASETDPKVIINDRVYRLNDLIDRTTQLRLIRVESSALVFIDNRGFEYRKSL